MVVKVILDFADMDKNEIIKLIKLVFNLRKFNNNNKKTFSDIIEKTFYKRVGSLNL